MILVPASAGSKPVALRQSHVAVGEVRTVFPLPSWR